jgi:hypothetical protein
MSKNASFLSRGLTASDVILKDVSLRERNYGAFEGSNVSKMIDEAKKCNLSLREYTPGEIGLDGCYKAQSNHFPCPFRRW